MNSAEKGAVLHCLRAMIDEAVCEECVLYGTTGTDHCEKDCVRMAIAALEQEPSNNSIKTELKPSDDWVDVPSDEMTLEQARAAVKDLRKALAMEKGAYNALVKNVQCEDCISRQAVEDAIYDYSRSCDVNFGQIMEYIEKIPPVVRENKTGQWSHDGSHWKNRYICSECGYKLFDEPTNFCPHCGAKMQEVEE